MNAVKKYCTHPFWEANPRYNYRICKFCSKLQYNYDGTWKNKIEFEQFINHWTPLDGAFPRIAIEAYQQFEFQCYESWGLYFKVKVYEYDSMVYKEFGPFGDLNQADIALNKFFGTHEPWESFNARVRSE